MKILIVHNRYRSSSSSGEDRVVDQEHEVLARAGHELERFERSSDDIARRSLFSKALIPTQVVWNPRAPRQLEQVIGRFGPDVVHVHNLFPLLSPSVLGSCERCRVPCVVTFHNYRPVCASGLLFRDGAVCRECVTNRLPTAAVRHGCYRGSSLATVPLALTTLTHRAIWRSIPSAYIFISDSARRELEPLGLPPERCFVKSNLVPPMAPPTSPRDGLVVYLGRLTEAKGLPVLQRAWDRYVEARGSTGLRLAIGGTGPLEGELRRWARGHPSVEILGLLDRNGCAALLGQARAVVACSENLEPFGLVVAEAMAAGVAPVATGHGSFRGLVTDQVDGVLYRPGDAAQLARIFERIEDNPAWVEELGAAARHTYERRFHPTRNIAELEAIYRFAIEHPRWLGSRPRLDRSGLDPVERPSETVGGTTPTRPSLA